MPAPSYNTFANALQLNGGSGSIVATYSIGSGSIQNLTNISCSSEISESSNYGHTCWFQFQAPGFISMSNVNTNAYAYYVSFSTIENKKISGSVITSSISGSINYTGSYNLITNPFNSVIQVFTQSSGPSISASVGNMVEMPYAWQSYTQSFLGNSYGGDITVLVYPNCQYYIRVDSWQQGNFDLNWGLANFLSFGSIHVSQSFQTDNTLRCLGALSPTMSFTGSTPTSRFANSQSYGSFPAGRYLCKYVAGAGGFTNTAPGVDVGWIVQAYAPLSPPESLLYYVNYVSASVTTRASSSNVSDFPSDNHAVDVGQPIYFNQREAEFSWLNACTQIPIVHSGGPIDLLYTISGSMWSIFDWGLPTFGNPDPIWVLYKVTPSLSYKSVCTSWNSASVSANAAWVIHNNNAVPWSVTASISGVGITNSDNQIYSMAPHTDTTITTNFSCSNVGITGQLTLTSDPTDFGAPISFNAVYLAPVLVNVDTEYEGFRGTCGGSHIRFDGIGLTVGNSGNWTVNPSVIGNIDHSLLFLNNSTCATSASMNFGPPGNLYCQAYPPTEGALELFVKAPSVNTACGITMSMVEYPLTYATYYFNTTMTP